MTFAYRTRALLAVALATACDGGPHRPPPTEEGATQRRSERLVWNEVAKLTASDERMDRGFGISIALGVGRMIVGAVNTAEPGLAYVLEMEAGAWVEKARVTGASTTGNDQFGYTVALDGDRFAVGAANDSPGGGNTGAAYAFERQTDGTWVRSALVPSTASDGDQFGWSVAISGDWAAVSADEADSKTGTVYMFRRGAGGTWTESEMLRPAIATQDFEFGDSVALEGARLVVGAPGAGDSGAVFVYERQPNDSWTEQAILITTSPSSAGRVGSRVALSGERLVAGAPGGGVNRAFVFTRQSNGTWTDRRLSPSAAPPGEFFGSTVAMDGDRLVVGTANVFSQPSGGSAYVFQYDGASGGWTEDARLLPSDPSTPDLFSFGVAVRGSTIALGRPGDRGGRGAVYVYDGAPPAPIGSSCTLGDQCGSGFCVDQVCCDALCDGACQACATALTGGTDGVCTPIPDGTDPEAECTDDGSPDCGQNGFCDGAGACATYAAPGCSPEACRLPADCTSGHCAMATGTTGICCDAPCDGVCESCLAAEQATGARDGVCGPIAAGTDPHGDCASTSAASCDGLCDGAGSCDPGAKSGSACGEATCENALFSAPVCGDQGACATRVSNCTPFACDAAGCITKCTTSDDCAQGFACDPVSGECKAEGLECSPDGRTSIGPNGETVPCSPYLCESGRCLDACTTSSDCDTRYVCDSIRSTCVSTGKDSSSGEDGGCGCRTTDDRTAGTRWWGIPCLLGLSLARRRRREPSGSPRCRRSKTVPARSGPPVPG